MRHVSFIDPADNPGREAPLVRFDGAQSNDARTTRLLAVLASVAGDHTADRYCRQLLHNAAGDLFSAADRMARAEQCGRSIAARGA